MCHEGWSAPEGTDHRPAAFDTEVGDGVLPGQLYEPPADGERRGPVLLLTDIYGTVPFYHEVCHQLARAGHPALIVDLFWRHGPLHETTREAAFARRSAMDEERGIADASAAADRLREHYGAERVGVVGFCIGGLFAFVLAADRSDLVTVSYYGFPEGIAVPAQVSARRPIDLVQKMTGPILAFWGDQDHNIPVDAMVRFGDAMAGTDTAYEGHIYEGVGHGFLQGIVEDTDDRDVAERSWRRTLELLAHEL